MRPTPIVLKSAMSYYVSSAPGFPAIGFYLFAGTEFCSRLEYTKPFSTLFVFPKAFEYRAFIKAIQAYGYDCGCPCKEAENIRSSDLDGTSRALDKVHYSDHHYHYPVVRDGIGVWDYVVRFRCLVINDSDSRFSISFGVIMNSWLLEKKVIDEETFLILVGSCGLTNYRCSTHNYAVNTIVQIRCASKIDTAGMITSANPRRNYFRFSPREEKVREATIRAPRSLRLDPDLYPTRTVYCTNHLYLPEKLPPMSSRSTSNNPVDMETYEFFEHCRTLGILNFTAFRIISDINNRNYYSEDEELKRTISKELKRLQRSQQRRSQYANPDDLRRLARLARLPPADYEDRLYERPAVFDMLREFVRKRLLTFDEDFIDSLMDMIGSSSISLA